jgi:ribosomal protein S18 acetylase RimI-like enzyme
MHTSFRFAHAKPQQKELIHRWLEQDYIKEWIHGVGLQNTLNGLERFFEGSSETIYWIGYELEIPFAFLITSPEGEDATTLDVFICNKDYLGKGLSVPLIRTFLLDHFSHKKKVLIDPEATNHRAIHVYKKVGFKIIGEFIASWHPVPHYQMELHLEDMIPIQQQALSEDLKKRIYEGFSHHAISMTGHDEKSEPVAFVAKDQNQFAGAIVVQKFWGSLHVKYVYVDAPYRNKGLGTRLLNLAFEYGVKNHCPFAFVETMSFQALSFYQKMGFELEFTRSGYAHDTSFHYLRKDFLLK